MVGVILRHLLAASALLFLVAVGDAPATTPSFPPVLLWVGPHGGASDLFYGGCPWEITGGLNGAAFLSVCRPGFYEGTGPYQVVLSRPPFEEYDVIAEDAVAMGEPAVSPDGRWVAFDVFPPNEAPHLELVRAGGTDRRVLAAGHYSAVWASDSKRLLARNDSTRTLDFVDLRGETRPFAPGTSAAWQPHGSLIAYVGPGGRLIVSRPDGRSRRVFGATQSDTCAWSPDGRVLAYVSESNRLFHGLVTWNVGTRRTRLLLHYAAGRPAWSPDGRRLAVVSSPYVTSVGYDLVTVGRNGGRASLLYPSINGPLRIAWLRGARIAFVSA